MNINYTKKEKILIISYLVMIVFLGLGISFSYFLLADSADKDSTRVYAGRLDISFIQGNEINTEVLYPIPKPDFNTKEKIYKNRFTVSTEGTLEQNVAISFNILENQFSEDMIRYSLYNGDGIELSTGYLNKGLETLIDNLYFKPIETREFVLIVWLEEKPFEQIEEQGCKLFGRIHVNSKQYGY